MLWKIKSFHGLSVWSLCLWELSLELEPDFSSSLLLATEEKTTSMILPIGSKMMESELLTKPLRNSLRLELGKDLFILRKDKDTYDHFFDKIS